MVSKEPHAPSEVPICEASILLLPLFTQVRGRSVLRSPDTDRAEPIQVLGSLCTTTTCRPLPLGVMGLRGHPRGSRRAIYARSCIRTSENFPLETVLESLDTPRRFS